ncbi:tyrosine-type recombinase/integrase [Streptomyces sp. NPDC087317]|uniref:tyrosine-type recombinase/integrase n=1 Tax=Streptomyces sp. NPDC087317 TaxID=3365784 RepID=UPI0037F729BE
MTASTITEEQLAELLTTQYIPAAHRALWALLWDGEIRLREALSLDVRDIDLNARTAQVDYRVKPAPTTAPISERATTLLREAIGEETEGPAIHRFGRPLSVRAASVIARTHGVSIHAFRASGPRMSDGAIDATNTTPLDR